MQVMDRIYPPGPENVPIDLTEPSARYKRSAWLAMASLALFVTLYLALAGWFVWTAYRVFGGALAGGKDTLLQFGIATCAAFLAIFMLKALFFVQRGGAPDDVEVTEEEQPGLFAFLYRIADEAGAPRPKRVYLSGKVNAAVFYDLSILNLIFPSRKNLEIGLPLVNVLTLSEIKAVLAHEFGHFAQRTMAIGIWVYIARQIASHVIARRDTLDEFLNFLSRVDVRIAWIGWSLSLIVWSIRSLMDSLLSLVILAQRALSRQMEFQADLVAVSLTGSDELVHALHKLQAADDAWDSTISFTHTELRNGRVPHDLFEVQTRIIERMAQILDDENYGRVPRASSDKPAHRVFKSGFAQPPQMWSTHPANHDREENAKRLYLAAGHDERSAWLLFEDVEKVKQNVSAVILPDVEAARSSREDTFRELDGIYAKLQYDSRFRGAYIGRPLTRHVALPNELYEEILDHDYVQTVLGTLYDSKFANDLARLKELEEELVSLQALRDKVYQAKGGTILYRGREISRRDLPAAIREVANEADAIRQRIFEHDRRCRGAHLAAASKLAGGWRDYLLGLIKVLHYSEHTLADLRDAEGLLSNVFAVVTADGKVSSRELNRLVATANTLHAVLEGIYQQQTKVILDPSLCKRLDVTGWEAMLEEFKLPPATSDNINQWWQVIDGWVSGAANALSSLNTAALEQLLQTEDEIARHLREGTSPAQAPLPSRIPEQYSTLLSGNERKRQTRLGLWDRFMTADGWLPGAARLLVAGGIVGAVLGFGGVTGTESTISVYNGLGTAVQVRIDGTRIGVAPFSATEVDIVTSKTLTIAAYSPDGRLIDTIQPELADHAEHYVYNVAGASPMIEWTAVYGTAKEQPPRYLGTPRWFTSSVDIFFQEPPDEISTSGGGGKRTVLSGFGEGDPDKLLEDIENDKEREQMILAHANWDRPDTPFAQRWQAIAAENYYWRSEE